MVGGVSQSVQTHLACWRAGGVAATRGRCRHRSTAAQAGRHVTSVARSQRSEKAAARRTDYCLPRSWWRQQAVLYPQCWETWWRNSWCLFKKPLKDCFGKSTKEDLTLARLSRFLLFWGLYRDSCRLNTKKSNVIKPNRTILLLHIAKFGTNV